MFPFNARSVLYRLYRSFQVILLEEAWAELFLLNAVQWCMPLETSPLFSVSEHAVGVPNGKDSQVAADVRVLNDSLLRFKAVGVDPAEFACLKAIVLFRSGEFPDLQDTWLVHDSR
jgi:nuclear receptor subfamily 2 group E protein 3